METTIEGNQFRTAEGRVATIDLGKALGLSDPLDANELVPEDEIETVMRLRTVPSSTAASAARQQDRSQLAEHLERIGSSVPAKQSEEPETISRVFQDNEIRIVQKNEEPWLVARDVCDALNIANTTRAVSRLDDDETSLHTMKAKPDAAGRRKREIKVINEPGTYRLIFTSRKEEAEEFKRWLAHDVLPEIRETGGYNRNQSQPDVAVEPQIEVNPDVQLDTDDLADKIAKGIADSVNGHQELPGSNMTPEEMREEIHTILGPWKDMDDYNPWTDLYDEAVNRNSNSVAIRTYWRRKMDMDGSKLDAAEAMHRDPEYPPALRVLLDTAQQFFGG